MEAYQQLIAEGYLTSRHGRLHPGRDRPRARRRSAVAAARHGAEDRLLPVQGRRLAVPARRVAALAAARAHRGLRRGARLRERPRRAGAAPGARGVPQPRAGHVRQARPDRDLQRLRARASGSSSRRSRRSGAKRIALEDPSADDDALPLARAAGLEVVGVPVDEDGIRVDALERTDADALVLTPSHQWPTGAVLSADRRAAVLRWARERRALVIEDDYDAEYRYDRAPIGAMQGLAPDLVAYAGTASKTLAPGLRLGWLVLPAEPGRRHRRRQEARRSRLARPRSAGLRRLPGPRRVRSPPAPDAPPLPAPPRRAARGAARAHARARAGRDRRRPAPRRLPAGRRRRDGRRRGRRPARPRRSTGWRPIASPATGRPGLIFGYATLDERALDEGVEILAEALQASAQGPTPPTRSTA